MASRSDRDNKSRLEQPRVEDFQKLLPVVMENGRQLAVGVICEDSNRSLVRIDRRPVLVASQFDNPQAPQSPEDGGNTFELQESREGYKQLLVEYNDRSEGDRQVLENHRQELQRWKSQSEERIKPFVPQLQPMLDRPVDCCQNTDIWAAIAAQTILLQRLHQLKAPKPRPYFDPVVTLPGF